MIDYNCSSVRMFFFKMVNGLSLYSASLVLMTTQSALQHKSAFIDIHTLVVEAAKYKL